MSSERLETKERLGLLLGGSAVLLVALFALYISTMDGKGTYPRYQKSSAKLESARDDLDLAKLQELNERERIASGADLEERLDARDPRFDLYSHMNSLLDACGLQGRAQIVNNPPSLRYGRGKENLPTVQLTLTGVSLKELVDFLHRVYAGRNLIVLDECDITPNAKEEGLLCKLKFQTVRT